VPLDLHEAEILKLVAANMPSHRGAWKRDSKAWQTFVRRPDTREQAHISEEGEDGAEAGLVVGELVSSQQPEDYEDEADSEDDFDGQTGF
jgi:hypothetical protein